MNRAEAVEVGVLEALGQTAQSTATTAAISTPAPSGSPATSTIARAGGSALNVSA